MREIRTILLERWLYVVLIFFYGVVFCFGQDKSLDLYLFLARTSSNTLDVTVTTETNIPVYGGAIYADPNKFYSEETFGERWLLKGWKKGKNKRILYDTHDIFIAKEEKRKKYRELAKSMSKEELKAKLTSTNETEKVERAELFKALFEVGGLISRRPVERASEVTKEKGIRLMHKICLTNLIPSDIRYLQLRIEPVGTNPMPVLLSNILDLQEPPVTNSP